MNWTNLQVFNSMLTVQRGGSVTEGSRTRAPGGHCVRTKINQKQSLFGSKGVVSIVFWIRGQICAFLVISNRLVQFAGSGVKKS